MPVLAADYPVPVIICHEHKPAGAREYWQWRQIDGKVCWFPGRRHTPKSELRWAPSLSPPGRGVEPESPADRLPLTPIEGSFEDRWQGLNEK